MTELQLHFRNFQIGKQYHELTQHGSPSFPVVFYETRPLLNEAGLISLHWHEEFQICLVTHGCVHFQCDQVSYELHENEGLLINSNHIHMARSSDPDSTYLCFAFHPKVLSSFNGSIIESLYVQPFINAPDLSAVYIDPYTDWGNHVLDKIKQIFDVYCEQSFGYQISVISGLLDIWNQIIYNQKEKLAASRSVESTDLQRTKLLMTYIQEHYSEDISLEELSDAASLSKGECCRLFKRITGNTPFEYLLMYRIKQSISLMKTTNKSIGEIASLTGFNSFSYYSVCFKKIIGTTPKQYRKQLS